MPADHIVWHDHVVDKRRRAELNRQRPCVLWFTGLSGAGKSTIAGAVETELFRRSHRSYLLDGDNIRHGLNRDLGFGDAERVENIRRIGEVARLFVDAGMIVLTAFISPFRRDRELVRSMLEPGEFIEIFVDAPLAECERRDPKGLYRRARQGEISRFTGIDSAYEPPGQPELTLRTDTQSLHDCVAAVLGHLKAGGFLASSRSGGS